VFCCSDILVYTYNAKLENVNTNITNNKLLQIIIVCYSVWIEHAVIVVTGFIALEPIIT